VERLEGELGREPEHLVDPAQQPCRLLNFAVEFGNDVEALGPIQSGL
jgi:hypothetical protein